MIYTYFEQFPRLVWAVGKLPGFPLPLSLPRCNILHLSIAFSPVLRYNKGKNPF